MAEVGSPALCAAAWVTRGRHGQLAVTVATLPALSRSQPHCPHLTPSLSASMSACF